MKPLIPARIETARLVLRTWEPTDRSTFAEINSDAEVTEHVGRRPLRRSESDAIIDRADRSWDGRGYGWYAVASRETGQLLGFCGLSHHRALPDEVEVGWRLARHAWGRGLATEAALVCRDLGFDVLGRDRLTSITLEANVRSLRVMQKIGMQPWRRMPFEEWELWIWAMTAADRDRISGFAEFEGLSGFLMRNRCSTSSSLHRPRRVETTATASSFARSTTRANWSAGASAASSAKPASSHDPGAREGSTDSPAWALAGSARGVRRPPHRPQPASHPGHRARRVETDGGEGELDGWTSQWTRTHVCIVRGLEPGRFRPFWV